MVSLKEQSEELFNLGLQYSENGQFEDAIECYDKVIRLSPNFAMAYVFHGKCEQELKNYDCALDDYDEAIRLAGDSGEIELHLDFFDIYYNIGICCEEFDIRNYGLTSAMYDEVVEGELFNSVLHSAEVNKVCCEMLERAVAEYSKAIKLNPSFADAYNKRGNCYIKLNNQAYRNYQFYEGLKAEYEFALSDYKHYADTGAGNNHQSFISSKIYYERVLYDYCKAIELNRRYADVYNNRKNFYDLALADYSEAIKLSDSSEYKKQLCFVASNVAVTAKEYSKAVAYIEQAFEQADSKEQQHEAIYLKSIEYAEELDIKNQELEKKYKQLQLEIQQKEAAQKQVVEKNQQLQAKEKELEDMMSMFAHKFRSPLDAIIYNTTHDKDTKLYTESANTMRGLLDIFSIISADDKILTDKIKNDSKGNATLMSVLNKNLNMTLLHLLSVSGMSKIHQHYMNYAKAQGKITDAVSYKEWCDDYFEMEGELQKQWEQEFSALLNQSASLTERLQWLEQYFFKLDIIGFEIESIQFKEYETTESFLFILMNEILVNAFKYYASENKQAVVLEWTATENYQTLSCRNPSIRRERDQHKGSGKGHTFLSALARKTGCKFTKPKPQDDFLLEFAIPNQLLLSNSGTEK